MIKYICSAPVLYVYLALRPYIRFTPRQLQVNLHCARLLRNLALRPHIRITPRQLQVNLHCARLLRNLALRPHIRFTPRQLQVNLHCARLLRIFGTMVPFILLRLGIAKTFALRSASAYICIPFWEGPKLGKIGCKKKFLS